MAPATSPPVPASHTSPSGTAAASGGGRASPKDIRHPGERGGVGELPTPPSASTPASLDADRPLSWVVGAFYTGLTALADRSADPKYAEAVLALGEREHWGL